MHTIETDDQMKKLLKLVGITLLYVVFTNHWAAAQNTVGIGTETPNKNAVLHLSSPSHNQGLLVPSLSREQRISATFINNLSSADNGLLVFDLDDKSFYYWQDNQWKSFSSNSQLIAGNGISIANNTISNTGDTDSTNEIQDLVLNANILSISNNSSATEIDLTPFSGTNTDNQILNLSTTEDDRTIEISGGNEITFSVADNDADSTNEIQDLVLNANILTISNNASATAIDLSPFSGTNTDNQNLSLASSGSERTINITGGTGITFNVDDNDNSASNEIQNLQSVLTIGNDAGSSKITNLGTPTTNTDAATKQYVDENVFSGDFSDLANVPNDLLDGDDVGITTVTTNATLNGDGNGTPLSIANNAINTARIANNAVTDAKIAAVAPSKIQAAGATTGQALLWDGSNWTPQSLPSGTGFNNANIIPKGNGTTMVNSQIFDNGSYIGVGRTAKLNATSYFEFDMPITGSTYGGLSINTTSATAKPYIGFWTAEALGSYIYYDGANNSFNIYSGSGTAFTIDNSRNIGIGANTPSAKLDVVGSTELNGTLATPAIGNVTVSGTTFNMSTPTRRVVRLLASGARPRIITMTAGVDGQEVILINAGNIVIDILGAVNTVNSNSMVLDNLGVSLTRYSTLHLIYDGSLRAWVEISRSLNEYIIN